DAGRLPLAPRPARLATTIEQLAELLAPRAEALGLEVATFVDPALPEVVVDEARLRQVLFNLAGNALKFTRTGGFTVEAEAVEPPGGGSVRVRFAVADTGPGIAEADFGRIFDEFEQAGSPAAGAGLGLSISRSIVRAM